MARNALIINGHQHWTMSEGNLNRSLVSVAESRLKHHGWTVSMTAVEQGYDVAEELDKIETASAIILQFPVFWYSVPWAMKKYIDLVFTSGRGRIYMNDGRSRSDPSRKYGSGGRLQSRKYMISSTWNAPASVFDDPDQIFKGRSVDDVLFGLHVGMQFVGLSPIASFSCHDVVKNGDPKDDLRRYAEHIDENFASLGLSNSLENSAS